MPFTPDLKNSLTSRLDKLLSEDTTPQDGVPGLPMITAGVTTSGENVYLAAKGLKSLDTKEIALPDQLLALYSCTKALTSVALLQLYDRKQVDLDALAKTYIPLIADIRLIDKGQVDSKTGEFKYEPRRPKTEVTVRHLMLHTLGFAYGFVSPDYLALALKKNRHVNALHPSMELFTTEKMPLVHEPGSKWQYGHSTDWIGLIVEAVSGQLLGNYLKENVFGPLGMDSCTFHPKEASRLVETYKRNPKEKSGFTPLHGKALDLDPKVDMGGQGCFGSARDYLKFLRMWLNKGVCGDSGRRILLRETAEYAIRNHLPEGLGVDFATGPSGPSHKPDGYLLAGCAYNLNDLPTGRPKGSLYWGGLANLFYFIDFENDVAGFWGTQVFPHMDKVALPNYIRFEFSIYDVLNGEEEEDEEGEEQAKL